MGNFVEGAMRDAVLNAHQFEDYLVKAEVELTKKRIIDAASLHRREVAWSYLFNDYDSYTTETNTLYSNNFNPQTYLSKPSDIGMFRGGGIVDFLSKKSASCPRCPLDHKVDYRYISEALKKELRLLGCKSIIIHIGPKSYTEKRFMKKGFFHDKYKMVTCNVIMWMVSISW